MAIMGCIIITRAQVVPVVFAILHRRERTAEAVKQTDDGGASEQKAMVHQLMHHLKTGIEVMGWLIWIIRPSSPDGFGGVLRESTVVITALMGRRPPESRTTAVWMSSITLRPI